jgi:hypothetical protein
MIFDASVNSTLTPKDMKATTEIIKATPDYYFSEAS